MFFLLGINKLWHLQNLCFDVTNQNYYEIKKLAQGNLYCEDKRSTALNILISRAVYTIMLKHFKLFLKLIEDWFLWKKLVDHTKLETCKVFRERLDKNNRDKKTKLSKIVQIVGFWRIWASIYESELQLNFATIGKIQHFIY